jgi:hypothetical protein
MTTAEAYTVTWDAEDETFLVLDADGDVFDTADTRGEAHKLAAGYAYADRLEEVRGEVESLVQDCESAELLERVKALLAAGK